MGGYGSGPTNGRPTADSSLRIDLAWMMRTGLAKAGSRISGSLNWTCRGEPSGSIGYEADLVDPNNAQMVLTYRRGEGERAESVRQEIPLTYTRPNYGGRRWWMICPYSGRRAGKLYLPNGGDRFASRTLGGWAIIRNALLNVTGLLKRCTGFKKALAVLKAGIWD